jgi:hypothetical protein
MREVHGSAGWVRWVWVWVIGIDVVIMSPLLSVRRLRTGWPARPERSKDTGEFVLTRALAASGTVLDLAVKKAVAWIGWDCPVSPGRRRLRRTHAGRRRAAARLRSAPRIP